MFRQKLLHSDKIIRILRVINMHNNFQPRCMLSIDRIKKEYLTIIGQEKQWLLSSRNNVPIVINTYSLDQFALYQITPEVNGKKLEDYSLRQMYNLPNTPKVILLSNNKNKDDIRLLLVQKAPYDFIKLMESCKQHKEVTKSFKKILNIIEMLYKKYGYFDINEKMIGATKGANPIVWIHSNQISNSPQFPIKHTPCQITVTQKNQIQSNIILKVHDLFKSYHKNWNLGLIKNKKQNNFQNTHEHIEQMLKGNSISQFQILSKTNKNQSDDRRFTIGKKVTTMPQFLKRDGKSRKPQDWLQKNSISTAKPQNFNKDSSGQSVNSLKLKYKSEKRNGKNQKQGISQSFNKNYTQNLYQKVNQVNDHFTFSSRQSIDMEQIQTKSEKQRVAISNQYNFDFKQPKNKLDSRTNIKQKYKKKINSNNCLPSAQKKKKALEIYIQPEFNRLNLNTCQTQARDKKQIMESNMENDFKTKIRDSGQSFSTTAQYLSINSSGKRRGFPQENIIGNFLKSKPKLMSTFGAKTSNQKLQQNKNSSSTEHKRLKLSGKFAVKASKIIQEKDEVAYSPYRRSPKKISLISGQGAHNCLFYGSNIEHQVSDLFKSQVQESDEQQFVGIEQQLNDILFS